MLRDRIFDVGIITKENVDNNGIIALPTDVAIIINNFGLLETFLLENLVYPVDHPIQVFILDTEFKDTSYPKYFNFDPSDTFMFVRVYQKEDIFVTQMYVDTKCAIVDINDLVKIVAHNIARSITICDSRLKSILNVLNFYNEDKSPEECFRNLVFFSLVDGIPISNFSRVLVRSLYSLSRAYN